MAGWDMATCTRCAAPLISTMAFCKYEFYCLECGTHLGFLSPIGQPGTPELTARYEALKAEWDEHAGAKLLTDDGWHADCTLCERRGEPHSAHATAEERAAHQAAVAWLAERLQRNRTPASGEHHV